MVAAGHRGPLAGCGVRSRTRCDSVARQGEAIAARQRPWRETAAVRGSRRTSWRTARSTSPARCRSTSWWPRSTPRSGRASRRRPRAFVRAVSRGRATILGHPTAACCSPARVPGRSRVVLQAAAASGAAVEINAHPFRLDLDWRWVRRAVGLGVPISIGPDAHEPAGLADVRWAWASPARGGHRQGCAQRQTLALVVRQRNQLRVESLE